MPQIFYIQNRKIKMQQKNKCFTYLDVKLLTYLPE